MTKAKTDFRLVVDVALIEVQEGWSLVSSSQQTWARRAVVLPVAAVSGFDANAVLAEVAAAVPESEPEPEPVR